MATVRRFSIGKIPEDKVFKGQPKVIMDHLKAHPKSTVAEMAKVLTFEGSRQTPERVIGFYMTTFKKQGLVKAEEEVVEDTKGEAAEADSGEEEEDDEENEEEAVREENLPMQERVEYHEELSADEPTPGGRFDGLKMTEAVRKSLELRTGMHTADELSAYLQENGYTASRNQVNGALINLVKQGVAKKDGNTYGRR
jgi:hypothetical protein